MDLPGKLEIYIPVEAEVKSIPLWSLPRSVLRRMGLPLSGSKGSEKLSDSPEGIWICPAVIRRKGQKVASHAGNNMMENLSSLLGREFRANPGPVQMSFVAANHAVYKALKDTMPGKKVSAPTSHASPLPRGSAPRVYKDAVILYNGHVYLSIRNPNESRTQPERREQQLASQSSIPSTSDVSSKSLKKRRSPPVSLGPAEPQRKKSHVTLPQTSSKQLKDRLTKPDNHSTIDQELLQNNRPKERRPTPRAAPGENKKVTMHRGSDVSSTTTTHHVPQSAGSRRHKEADGQQAAEEAAGTEPPWFQPQGGEQQQQEEEEEEANNNCGEHEMVTDDEETDYTHVDSGEADNTVGIVEQSGNQSWTTRKSQEFDFKQLAEEEKIARLKAKLEQDLAALNNLHHH
ncbi:ligand-dependent nuclear receptor-interacting factor 1 isoform X2 [Cebidichthys violaceus]